MVFSCGAGDDTFIIGCRHLYVKKKFCDTMFKTIKREEDKDAVKNASLYLAD